LATQVERAASGRVVAIWICLLVLVAIVVQASRAGALREQFAAVDRPWIGLPAIGTDVTDVQARRALEQRLHAGAASLALRCGAGSELPDERYIGQVSLGDGSKPLQVLIDVHGDIVTLAPVAGSPWPGVAAARQAVPLRFQREQLKGVREAWTTPLLWGRQSPGELDEPGQAQARLEGCVEGGYALRTSHYASDVKALHAALSQAIAHGTAPAARAAR